MLISVFDKSIMSRKTGYTPTGENDAMEPVMQIRNTAAGVSYIIPLPSIYKYAEPKNNTEICQAVHGLVQIAEALRIAVDPSSMRKLQEYIEDGIDDLIKMKPYSGRDKKPVAEFTATINGQKHSGEITE